MNVTIHIPSSLRAYCQIDLRELVVSAGSVGDALAQLRREHPQLYRSVCNETGAVRAHVHLFVNSSLLCGAAGLDTQLAEGDELFIMPAVSGG